jgi:hypothetical protein
MIIPLCVFFCWREDVDRWIREVIYCIRSYYQTMIDERVERKRHLGQTRAISCASSYLPYNFRFYL